MGAQGFLKQLDLDEQLLKGIAAARDGRRSEARAILLQVVEREERNEQAWLWLAGVMDDPADARTCLENVLELNPSNARARQGLEWLDARAPKDAPKPAPAPRPADAATATERERAPAPARPAPAAAAQPAAPPVQAPLQDAADLPCPYCSAPTVFSQRSCTQCRQSLMAQTPPAEKPSGWLGALSGAWALGGAALGLGAIGYLAAAVLSYQAARFAEEGAAAPPDVPLPIGLVTIAVALLVGAGALLSLAGALRHRQLPAYYAAVVALPIGLVLAGFAMLRGAAAAPLAALTLDPATAGGIGAALGALLALLLVTLLAAAALAGLAYRDFFGPMERIRPVVKSADPTTHYNNGVLYKNRGMWYMATREWERAVAQSPRDINYLRALGLAYAQLKRFPQARDMLGRALALAPGHAQLLEDQTLVEGLASKDKR